MTMNSDAYVSVIGEIKLLATQVEEVQRRLSKMIMPPAPPEPGVEYVHDAYDWLKQHMDGDGSFYFKKGMHQGTLRVIFRDPADEDRYRDWLYSP